MSEEFGPDFVSVTDDEGNEFELEHLGTLEHQGTTYMAFLPADMDEQELDTVYDLFMEQLFSEEDAEE